MKQQSELVHSARRCPRCRSDNVREVYHRDELTFFECGVAVCRQRFHCEAGAPITAPVSPTSPKTAATPASSPAAESSRPKCPYCLTSHDMRRIGWTDHWTCERKHHSQVVVDADGKIVRADPPTGGGPSRSSRMPRRQYDSPVDDGPRKGVAHGEPDHVTIVI
jgi:hypothetical protein